MIDSPNIPKVGSLLALCRDPSLFATIFEWFRPRLYARALRICGNCPFAKDAVQDTFIQALTHLHTLQHIDSIYPWLRRILINNCLQLLRREKIGNPISAIPYRDQFIHHEIDAHFDKITHQQQVYATLQELSEELRSCVLLRYFSSFSKYEDIAQLLAIPVGTVRSRLSAARKKMATLYHLYEDPTDQALRHASEWSAYYRQLWANIYDDAGTRDELFQHLHPAIFIRFTSGKHGTGRRLIEKEVSDDLYYGSRFKATEIITCANMSIIEGVNLNTREFPDRCPPSSALILFRTGPQVTAFHLFDAPRK